MQIAGLVARRIVCFVKEGDELSPGERFGMIRFGSRLDVYLPLGANVLVAEGQTRDCAARRCWPASARSRGDARVRID